MERVLETARMNGITMSPSNQQSRLAASLPGWALLWFAPGAPAQDVQEGPSLSLSAAYTGDLRRNTTGGQGAGTAYSDAADLGLVWVTDSLFSGARMTSSLSVMYLGGGDLSGEYLGDLQGVNNLEAGNGWKLYESWVEVGFGDSSHSLRAGVLDLNAEFDTPVTQGIFTASPFGIGSEFSQTGTRGPVCWPTTGLGLRAAGDIRDSLHWRLGAYDGAPGTDQDSFTSTRVSGDEGALFIGELEYSSERIHKLALGAWVYSAEFERIDASLLGSPAQESGNRGFYAHFDTRLGAAGAVDFDGALRAGTAAARFNAMDRYLGAAITASHFLASRPGDSLGFGVAWARVGDEYRALRSFDGQAASSAETTFELVYRAELSPWLSVLPNLQFVRDPGADPLVGDAWVAGLRFELTRDRSWRLNAQRAPAADESYARAREDTSSDNRSPVSEARVQP
jgi:porin